MVGFLFVDGKLGGNLITNPKNYSFDLRSYEVKDQFYWTPKIHHLYILPYPRDLDFTPGGFGGSGRI